MCCVATLLCASKLFSRSLLLSRLLSRLLSKFTALCFSLDFFLLFLSTGLFLLFFVELTGENAIVGSRSSGLDIGVCECELPRTGVPRLSLSYLGGSV